MAALVKIIAVMLIVKGILFMVLPNLAKKALLEFVKISELKRRMFGLIAGILGITVFYLTRINITSFLIHWILVVFSIIWIIECVFFVSLPNHTLKFFIWFVEEKKPNQITGAILSFLGILILILI